jgi:hypothetical protein
MGMSRDEKRRRNVGLLANVTERDVRVMAQLKRAGVIQIELGELRVSFDAYDGEIEVEGDSDSDSATVPMQRAEQHSLAPAADDDCDNDHSGFEVVTRRPGDDEIN